MYWPRGSELIVVRHGESSYNTATEELFNDERYPHFLEEFNRDPFSEETFAIGSLLNRRHTSKEGDGEVYLSEEGWNQSRRLGEHIAAGLNGKLPDPPQVVQISSLLRAQQTFEGIIEGWPGILDGLEEEPVNNNLIREREHGLASRIFQIELFLIKYKDQIRHYYDVGPYNYKFPQGESLADLCLRARLCLQEIQERHGGKRVLLVTHSLFTLALEAEIEDRDKDGFMELYERGAVGNCGVSLYKRDNMGRMELDSFDIPLE